jgi:pimeloyl-ACP methyl ester carboxylesterase
MASYVLVHGGSHGGWCWRRVIPRLRAAGHEVHAPTLTGVGERRHLVRPDTNLDTHVLDVVNLLKFEGLSDVILVGHSYGGMVITGVADQVPDLIAHLVYLDAAAPADGESLVDIAPDIMADAYRDWRVVDGVELVRWPTPQAPAFYGVTEPADVAWVASKLTPMPWKAYAQPLRLQGEERTRRIPYTMINCTPTLRRRSAEQVRRITTGERVWEIDTGHDAMISAPEALSEMLLRLAPAPA